MSGMAFTYRVLENSARNYILEVIGVDADGTTAATQDGSDTGIITANGYTPTTHFKVRRLIYNTQNCTARLRWHANSDVDLAVVSGYGQINLKDTQGIWNDAGTGISGDIDLYSVANSTVVAGMTGPITASMTLVLECIKGA